MVDFKFVVALCALKVKGEHTAERVDPSLCKSKKGLINSNWMWLYTVTNTKLVKCANGRTLRHTKKFCTRFVNKNLVLYVKAILGN